ncbi:MAG: S-layer homology domain-containing protein, partial [Bacillota bacterium]
MRRRFRLLSILLAVVFLIALVPPVGAATPAVDQPLTMDEAISLLQLHGIVKGDERGNLNLYSNITRAEAAAIFVRAKNMSAFAPQLADLVPFSDARGKWFSGEVAMAYQLGLMKGDPDGRFRPNDQITYAEFLTVLLRMIGQEPSGRWDPATIMWKAAEVGILPSGVTSSQPAVRQQAFWALASAMTVPLANGRTLLQDFDMVPPDLRIGNVASETTDESITLTGTATGAYKVLVNGKAATLESRTGAFEAKVDLEMGRNDFTIQAFDRAGNVAQRTVTIERKPKVSVIEIEGPELIKPNTSVKLTIKAYDEKGKEVALEDATYTLSNKNHQFDPKTNTLKTGTQRGKATLTVTAGSAKGTYEFEVAGPSDKVKALRIEPINEGRAPAPDREYEVRVVAIDEAGNVVTEDYGRKITLKADSRYVTITPKEAQTEDGVAVFTMEADREDYFYLTASSDGLDDAEVWVEVLDSPRIMLVASKDVLEPDDSVRIRAVLMNDRGREIENDGKPIVIELEEVSGYGYFTGSDNDYMTEVTIDEDESTSDRVTFV